MRVYPGEGPSSSRSTSSYRRSLPRGRSTGTAGQSVALDVDRENGFFSRRGGVQVLCAEAAYGSTCGADKLLGSSLTYDDDEENTSTNGSRASMARSGYAFAEPHPRGLTLTCASYCRCVHLLDPAYGSVGAGDSGALQVVGEAGGEESTGPRAGEEGGDEDGEECELMVNALCRRRSAAREVVNSACGEAHMTVSRRCYACSIPATRMYVPLPPSSCHSPS